MWMTTVCGSDT